MIHVVHIYANETHVPYINWFVDRKEKYPDLRFTVIALYKVEPRLVSDMKERGCEVYWLKYDSDKRKRGLIISFFKLLKLLNRLKPDVVHTYLFDDSLPVLLAGRVLGISKRIIYKQETGFHWTYFPKWVWFDKFNNKNATQIVATSGESRQFVIEKEGVAPEKVSVIYPGTDINTLRAQSEEVKKQYLDQYDLRDKIVVGTIARFIEWKGYRYIVQAAVELKKIYPNIRFLFIGQGEQMEEIKQLAKKLGVDDIICFLGWVDEDKIPSLFGVMNMYLHASFLEPFGYIYSEAMLNEVPIITNETGGAKDSLTHKVNCYFTEPKTPNSVVEGVEWMLENMALIEKTKKSNRERAEKDFNVDLMLEKFVQMYRAD